MRVPRYTRYPQFRPPCVSYTLKWYANILFQVLNRYLARYSFIIFTCWTNFKGTNSFYYYIYRLLGFEKVNLCSQYTLELKVRTNFSLNQHHNFQDSVCTNTYSFRYHCTYGCTQSKKNSTVENRFFGTQFRLAPQIQ